MAEPSEFSKEPRRDAQEPFPDQADTLRPSQEDFLRVLHELRVHQVELELQNEELRLTQAALEESRGKYADLYDSAPVALLTLDRKGHILDINLTGASLLGLDRQWLYRKPFDVFVAQEDLDVFRAHRAAVFQTPQRRVDEILISPKSGGPPTEPVPPFHARMESTVSPNAAGQPVCRTALIDITSRVKAEAELRAREERLRLAVADVRNYAIFILDPDGRVACWNAGAQRTIGYTEGEVVGRSVALLYNDDDVQRGLPRAALESASRQGRVEACRWLIRKDRSRFWSSISITKLAAARDRDLGFSVIVHDLTGHPPAVPAFHESR